MKSKNLLVLGFTVLLVSVMVLSFGVYKVYNAKADALEQYDQYTETLLEKEREELAEMTDASSVDEQSVSVTVPDQNEYIKPHIMINITVGGIIALAGIGGCLFAFALFTVYCFILTNAHLHAPAKPSEEDALQVEER